MLSHDLLVLQLLSHRLFCHSSWQCMAGDFTRGDGYGTDTVYGQRTFPDETFIGKAGKVLLLFMGWLHARWLAGLTTVTRMYHVSLRSPTVAW